MDFDLFVVYAAADRDFVNGYLLPALNVSSSRVLLVDQLTPGALLVAEIERGVSRSRFTVAVLSVAYLEDRWAVFGEQLASYLSVGGSRVIPLLLAECEIPLHLGALVPLDFTDRSRWDSEAARFRDLLHTASPAAEPIACPYPGMRPFTADEANWFFSRDKEVDDLLGRLDRGEREIYVIGPSGSGKSSLVQAGLLPRLATGSSRIQRSFVVRTMRPGERPSERLAHVFDGDPETPEATITALVGRHPPAERALVFIDQLEELFTLADLVERQRFVATFRALRAEPRCYFLLALRAEFCGALMESALWPELAGRISRVEVAPLRGQALAQAITAPAMRVGVFLAQELCKQLVVDAADEPGALPLVQETLRLLWDKRRDQFLGIAEYEDLGGGGRGLHVAIAQHADATMRTLSIAQQTIARRVLLRLVSFGEGRLDTRRQQAVQALRSAANDEAELVHVLQRLVDKRLVTIDGGEGSDNALADLSHEALITAWPVLRAWIDQRRADEQHRRRLELRVHDWIERGRGTRSLFDLVELSEAEQWMQSDAARELGYDSDLSALVEASRGEIENVVRQRRRQAFRSAAALATVVVLFITSILGFVAWRQRREAQRRLGLLYLKEAQDRLHDDHPMQALPYFVAAKAEATEITVPRGLLAQLLRTLPLVTFVGHRSAVAGASFSADGRRVVTVSDDKTAQLWDSSTGKPVALPLQHQGFVYAAVFSPDGKRVVTASGDKTARIWDAATGAPVTNPLEHAGEVNIAVFSPDGKQVITGSGDKTARIWNAITGLPVARPFPHSGKVTVAAFSPDGRRVLTASGDTVQIWDASTGKSIAVPLEHSRDVTAAAFSPDGTRVVTASLDATARAWDAFTGQALIPPLEHQGAVRTAVFSPDGTRVVTASDDNTARVWDVKTGKPVTPPLEHPDLVYTASFSPDGTRVVTASGDKMARVWSAATGPVLPAFEHRSIVDAAAFSPDGTRVITASQDRTARIWDTSTGKPVTLPLKHQGIVYAVAFSPDGAHAVTASQDKTARIWDAATGKSVARPLEHQGSVFTAAFDSTGTRVVTASEDKVARIWDAMTGEPVITLLGHQGQVNAATFSPDGKHVVTASFDNTARVWDAVTGQPVTPPLEHKSFVLTAVFSPDGKHIVTASGDLMARVWDAQTGKPVTPSLEHRGLVYAAAFSPDGRRVVTASDDGTARVWDAQTGTAVTPVLEHRGVVYAAAFNPDGSFVVTASLDKTARVWDASTGQPMAPVLEHQGAVRSAVFSPDGTRVVTASEDRTARVWVLDDIKAARVWTFSDRDLFARLRLLARCSPFAQINGELTANSDPIPLCPD